MGAKIHNHTFMPLPGTPFRNQKAGQIDEAVKQQIVELTTTGKAYGKWSGQITIAKDLERLQAKN